MKKYLLSLATLASLGLGTAANATIDAGFATLDRPSQLNTEGTILEVKYTTMLASQGRETNSSRRMVMVTIREKDNKTDALYFSGDDIAAGMALAGAIGKKVTATYLGDDLLTFEIKK